MKTRQRETKAIYIRMTLEVPIMKCNMILGYNSNFVSSQIVYFSSSLLVNYSVPGALIHSIIDAFDKLYIF